MYWIGLLLALIGGLISIVIVRSNLKKRLPFLSDIIFDVCSVFLLVLGLCVATVNYMADQHQIGSLTKDLVSLKDYGEVATWNFHGSKIVGSGVAVSSPVGNWRKDFVKEEDGRLSWKCNQDAINQYKLTTEKHINYPFPYYLLAVCLKNVGDNSWRTFAQKGISILEHTTKVSGHDPGHDDALGRLKSLVASQD
jgi:hypothetical protein